MSFPCEINTRRLLIELGVIGQVTRGYKLNTKEAYISLDDSTWYQGALRTYRGDSRQMMISKINNVVEQSEVLVNRAIREINSDEKQEHFHNLRPRHFLAEIRKYLVEAEHGIENLKITYSQDRTIVSCLDTSIITLKSCLDEIDSCKISSILINRDGSD